MEFNLFIVIKVRIIICFLKIYVNTLQFNYNLNTRFILIQIILKLYQTTLIGVFTFVRIYAIKAFKPVIGNELSGGYIVDVNVATNMSRINRYMFVLFDQ